MERINTEAIRQLYNKVKKHFKLATMISSGKWLFVEKINKTNQVGVVAVKDKPQLIAIMVPSQNQEADAKLMAAAKELLEEAHSHKNLLDLLIDNFDDWKLDKHISLASLQIDLERTQTRINKAIK